MPRDVNRACGFNPSNVLGGAVGMLAILTLATIPLDTWAGRATAPGSSGTKVPAQAAQAGAPREVVVYVSALPKSALSEFEFWSDPASPGGKLVGTPNTGGHLDPPPEDDPHVKFKVRVEGGTPYRCWVRMKVGTSKGESQANLLWAQFTDAVDKSGREYLKPGTKSYLTAQGTRQPGWAWVPCVATTVRSDEPLVRFRTSGEITVRLQAGMEGVGFDQFVLSPARYLDKPPAEAVVKP